MLSVRSPVRWPCHPYLSTLYSLRSSVSEICIMYHSLLSISHPPAALPVQNPSNRLGPAV